MTLRLMIDISSNNPLPDLAAHHAAGYRVLALKATEGVSYRWSDHHPLADTWHRLGGRVVHYHFARAGASGMAQADYFLAAVRGHLARGDRYALDMEPQPGSYRQWTAGEPALVAHTFIDRVTATGPKVGPLRRRVPGMIYGSPAFLTPAGVRKRNGWRLWLAEYGPRADVPPSWRRWTAWQFTDRATGIPGVHGAVDQSHVTGWLLPTVRRPLATWPTLRVGAHGGYVRRLQTLLNTRTGAALDVDGAFGPLTRRALNRYKTAHHWTPDGVCGQRVWRSLTDPKETL